MKRVRVIPILLIDEGKFVKTIKFKDPSYVGDPINAVKIFNEKEVDEISVIDISATKMSREPNYQLISDIAGEAFMPLSYGGGIKSVNMATKVFKCGVEKVIINDQLIKNLNLIDDIKSKYGSQSVVASVDIIKNWYGKYKYLTIQKISL